MNLALDRSRRAAAGGSRCSLRRSSIFVSPAAARSHLTPSWQSSAGSSALARSTRFSAASACGSTVAPMRARRTQTSDAVRRAAETRPGSVASAAPGSSVCLSMVGAKPRALPEKSMARRASAWGRPATMAWRASGPKSQSETSRSVSKRDAATARPRRRAVGRQRRGLRPIRKWRSAECSATASARCTPASSEMPLPLRSSAVRNGWDRSACARSTSAPGLMSPAAVSQRRLSDTSRSSRCAPPTDRKINSKKWHACACRPLCESRSLRSVPRGAASKASATALRPRKRRPRAPSKALRDRSSISSRAS
mmetsp:Transcript_32051/g.110787  ORF Transcript_32051/g.110787 Transcript_32051/m.110787 type:complete len:310 (+) Transcript_32051:381-1310(+)